MATKKTKKIEKYEPTEIEKEAIALVQREKQLWENALAYITERVAFKMQDLIRTCRKNYFGVFDNPIDPITGREKVWIPLTEMLVEAVVKNIDLDTKDINFRAKNKNGYATKDVIRALVKDYLDRAVFGETLDESERRLARDGTIVWKTYEYDGQLIRRDVDLLNIYIDPTSPSIREAYRFTERSLMYPNEIEGMTGWENTRDLQVREGLPRVDAVFLKGKSQSNVKMVDVYEMWGKIPKRLITSYNLKATDAEGNQEVDGRIVVSGLDSGNVRCHLIEENAKKDYEGMAVKPYEEAWYKKIPGRWYGKGIAEQVLMIQLWINTIVNIRINRSYIAQLGLFKVKKGSGVTAQMLSRLGTNGAIQVNSMDDIEQFVMNEASQASYEDEKVAVDWAQRITNAFEIVTGERLPSSTPATNAAIQNTNAMSGFTMVKEQLGMFLQRWMDRHALPIIVKTKTKDDIIRIVGNDEMIDRYIERAVAYEGQQLVEDMLNRGHIPAPQEVEMEMNLAEKRLREKGELFIQILKDLVADHVDTEVSFTNENLDTAVMSDKLINLLNAAPEYRDSIVAELFNIFGLPQPDKPKIPPQMPGMPGQPGQAPQPGAQQGGPNMQQIATQANTMQ